MQDVGDRVTLRVNYSTSVQVLAISLAAVSALLFAPDISKRHFQFFLWLIVVLGTLLCVLAISWIVNFLKLTPVGFSVPIHNWRMFTKWSDIGPFEAFDKRILGLKCRGVGFNYAGPMFVKARSKLTGYDRVIFGTYGGMESAELARFLNQWRAMYANKF